MIFGKYQLNCITYREHEREFILFRRKYINDIRVCVDKRNFEAARGIEVGNKILVQTKHNVIILDSKTYRQEREINLSLNKSKTREPI